MLSVATLACGTALHDVPVYVCPTEVPPTILPGTPQPPPPTPVVITPPQDFYAGDPVIVGTAGAPLRVQFRLLNAQSFAASPDEDGRPRRVYVWQLEVSNLGSEDYELFPALQMYLSTIATPAGEVTGAWGSSQAAADETGLTIDNDTAILLPGERRVFRLAAYGPAGTARRFTFTLDPTVTAGSGTITWVNATNPYCPTGP